MQIHDKGGCCAEDPDNLVFKTGNIGFARKLEGVPDEFIVQAGAGR